MGAGEFIAAGSAGPAFALFLHGAAGGCDDRRGSGRLSRQRSGLEFAARRKQCRGARALSFSAPGPAVSEIPLHRSSGPKPISITTCTTPPTAATTGGVAAPLL